MRIKIHDQVQMLSGKDRGKQGKVTQILPRERMVVVEGLNKMFKHLRPQKKGDKGQRVEFAAPVSVHRLMLICPKCSKRTRIGMVREGVKKFRRCMKCRETIE